LLDEVRPDLVWAIGIKAATLSVGPCRLHGTPIVWHKVDLSLDAWLTKPLALAVDRVIGVSEAACEALGSNLRRRRLAGVVGPPVALPNETRASLSLSHPVIGSMGSMQPTKGHHILIEAASSLLSDFPELRVSIAGADSRAFPRYRAELDELARELGVGEHVEILQFADAREFLERLTVYVSGSYKIGAYGSEGLGGAMVEASWAGLPVVATRTGGTPEGLIDGVTGILVTPGEPGSLAEGIRLLLTDPQRARQMGEQGRLFAHQNFAPQPLAARLFSLLAEAAR
jgi:glycosyltransferase involved in cell wall biosynthesis